METPEPLPMRWTGREFVPHPQAIVRAVAGYEVGKYYPLGVERPRSDKSHGHEFAFVNTAWENLPEHMIDDFPTSEHLRKWALIRAGFHDQEIIDCGTKAAALRVAASVRRFPGETFSHVVTRDHVVVIRRARSQSRRAMGNADFQASKQAVLEALAVLLEVTPESLAAQGSPTPRLTEAVNVSEVAA